MAKHIYYLVIYYHKKTIKLYCYNFAFAYKSRYLRSKKAQPSLIVTNYPDEKLLCFNCDKICSFVFDFVR